MQPAKDEDIAAYRADLDRIHPGLAELSLTKGLKKATLTKSNARGYFNVLDDTEHCYAGLYTFQVRIKKHF